jgi:hypothetical protein
MKKMTQICLDLGNEGTTKQISRFLQQVPADGQIMKKNTGTHQTQIQCSK